MVEGQAPEGVYREGHSCAHNACSKEQQQGGVHSGAQHVVNTFSSTHRCRAGRFFAVGIAVRGSQAMRNEQKAGTIKLWPWVFLCMVIEI